jgi:chromosomal replication initiation ATPase DnaA
MFGGRDHTTVLHACRKIQHILTSNQVAQRDYDLIMKQLNPEPPA